MPLNEQTAAHEAVPAEIARVIEVRAGRTSWSSSYQAVILDHGAARERGELLNGEIFYSRREAKVVIKQWRPALQRGPTAFIAQVSTAGA
jgi:hypothetical protein